MSENSDPLSIIDFNHQELVAPTHKRKLLKKIFLGLFSICVILFLLFVLGSIDRYSANDEDILVSQTKNPIEGSENAYVPLREAVTLIQEKQLKDPVVPLSNGVLHDSEEMASTSLFRQVINGEQFSPSQLETTLRQWSVVFPFILEASKKEQYQVVGLTNPTILPTRPMVRSYAIQAMLDSKKGKNVESLSKYQQLIRLLKTHTSSGQIGNIGIFVAESNYRDVASLIKQSDLSEENKALLTKQIKNNLEDIVKNDMPRAEKNEYTEMKNEIAEGNKEERSIDVNDNSINTNPLSHLFAAITDRYHGHFNTTQSKIAEVTRKRIDNASQGCSSENSNPPVPDVSYPTWKYNLVPNGHGEEYSTFFTDSPVSISKSKVCSLISQL